MASWISCYHLAHRPGGHLSRYQNPQEPDTMSKVQAELDETKIILHNTMESLLERGGRRWMTWCPSQRCWECGPKPSIKRPGNKTHAVQSCDGSWQCPCAGSSPSSTSERSPRCRASQNHPVWDRLNFRFGAPGRNRGLWKGPGGGERSNPRV